MNRNNSNLIPFVSFKSQNLLLEILSFLVHKELQVVQLINQFSNQFIKNPFNFKQIVSWPPSIADNLKWNSHISNIIYRTGIDEKEGVEKGRGLTESEGIGKITEFLRIYPNLHVLYIGYSTAAKVASLTSILHGILSRTNTIREIQLQNIEFTNISKLFEGIQENNRIKKLDFASCRFKQDLGYLCDYIEKTKVLEYLEMKDNELDTNGFTQICTAIGLNRSIKGIDFGSNKTGPVVGSILFNSFINSTTLQILYLNNMLIGDKGTEEIGQLLKRNQRIRELYIQKNGIGYKGAQALGEALKTNFGLQTLSVANNELGVSGIRSLAQGPISNEKCGLLFLNVSTNGILDEGVVELGKYIKTTHCKLKNLIVRNNGITGEGAMALAEYIEGNREIVHLNIQRNSIGSKGADALIIAISQVPKCAIDVHVIKKLNLYSCGLEMESALLLESTVMNLRSLTFLDLSSNLFGVLGVTAMFRLLFHNPSLRTLDISDNIRGPLEDQKELEHQVYQSLLQNKHIQNLHMGKNSYASGVIRALGEGLKGNKTLQKIGLHQTGIDDNGLIAIGNMLLLNRSLLILEIEWNNITKEGIMQFIDLIKPNEHISFINMINLALPKADLEEARVYAIQQKPNVNIRLIHWKKRRLL